MKAATVRVRGIVQGVGFRPTVWQLATGAGLAGEVINDSDGVQIFLQGQARTIDSFAERLRQCAPPLSRIDSIEVSAAALRESLQDFRIGRSGYGSIDTGICADAATCAACLAEMRDPHDRRYRYPFTNCTHCGPRFSIANAIPWDRPHTSMQLFDQCPACLQEYVNPADRRFHAQPNACPACGPHAWFETSAGERQASDSMPDSERLPESDRLHGSDPLLEAARRLALGQLIAIKGIGGFHIACDARNDAAVRRLRAAKHRPHKPLAVMMADLAMTRLHTACDALEAELLQGSAAPIVLLRRRSTTALSDAIAPGIDLVGAMLPYSGLHALLMDAFAAPLVMTSGNRAGKPPCIDNGVARSELADIVDGFVMHDRLIENRIDDSVVRVIDGQAQLLRRARGYAPMPISLPEGLHASRPLLAYGAETKHTFCLARHGKALLSQHIGDLENAATLADFERNLDLWSTLYQDSEHDIALDAHPEYLSSKLALSHQLQNPAGSLPACVVQHHHAHFAACLADNGLGLQPAHPYLGIVLDGLGMGSDGTLWGGEFLLGTLADSQRVAALRAVPLPGGHQAILQPWRNLMARVHDCPAFPVFLDAHPGHPLSLALQDKPTASIRAMIDQGINCPASSSAGRLFDAVAASLGIAFDQQSFEGQAAMQLESLATSVNDDDTVAYPFHVTPTTSTGKVQDLPRLDDSPLWPALLEDLGKDVSPGTIAARFHRGLARALAGLGIELARRHGVSSVALSGGVLQNRLLAELLAKDLGTSGLLVLQHRQLPANDGGIAFGQVITALARQADNHSHRSPST